MCRRADPINLLPANIAVIRRLRDEYGHLDIGRRLTIDGTFIHVPRPQRQGYSKRERGLIARGLSADYGKHDAPGRKPKQGFGFVQIVIGDVASTLPLVWALFPFSHREHRHVTDLLDLLFRFWPDCPAEALIGDSEYDGAEWVAEARECAYGVHPIFPLRDNIAADWEWVDRRGVPYCSKHGFMKLEQPEGFVNAKKRRELGLAPGDPIDLTGARMRWACGHKDCPARATTYPHKNWRLYTYWHRDGMHKNAGMRDALLLRRLGIESIFSSLKGKKLGLGGQAAPRWIQHDRHMEWLIGTGLLGLTLNAYVHESGLYQQKVEEAERRGWISDPEDRPVDDEDEESQVA